MEPSRGPELQTPESRQLSSCGQTAWGPEKLRGTNSAVPLHRISLEDALCISVSFAGLTTSRCFGVTASAHYLIKSQTFFPGFDHRQKAWRPQTGKERPLNIPILVSNKGRPTVKGLQYNCSTLKNNR